jgi:hypothetical protein
MRVFAVVTSRSGAFSVGGTMTVITAGAIAGLVGGALRWLADRPLRHSVRRSWLRGAIFGSLFFAVASPGVRPPWLMNFLLFGACFLVYALLLEWLAGFGPALSPTSVRPQHVDGSTTGVHAELG